MLKTNRLRSSDFLHKYMRQLIKKENIPNWISYVGSGIPVKVFFYKDLSCSLTGILIEKANKLYLKTSNEEIEVLYPSKIRVEATQNQRA